MAKLKIIIYYLIEVILSLVLLLLILLFTLKTTIFNKNYLLKTMDKNNYYEYVDKSIKEDMSNTLIPSQLPEEVLNNIYSKKQLKNDINTLINNLYKNNNKTIDTSNIYSNLEDNINKYLEENNIEVLDDNSIDIIIKQMTDIYTDKITQSNMLINISKYTSKIKNIITLGIIINAILLIGLYILSIKTYKDNNISLSLFISSFITIFISKYITMNININNIYIWDDNISNILHVIVNNIFNKLFIISILFIIIGIILIWIKRENKAK